MVLNWACALYLRVLFLTMAIVIKERFWDEVSVEKMHCHFLNDELVACKKNCGKSTTLLFQCVYSKSVDLGTDLSQDTID